MHYASNTDLQQLPPINAQLLPLVYSVLYPPTRIVLLLQCYTARCTSWFSVVVPALFQQPSRSCVKFSYFRTENYIYPLMIIILATRSADCLLSNNRDPKRKLKAVIYAHDIFFTAIPFVLRFSCQVCMRFFLSSL